MTVLVGARGRLYRQLKALVPPSYRQPAKLLRDYTRHRDLTRLVNELQVERTLSRLEVREGALLREARRRNEAAYRDLGKPLVSVTIATYNRAELLTTRALASVLRQTYQNFEVIVVGDACTDDTAARIERLGDPRIRFHNLPVRGDYPVNPTHRWMVAGSVPLNLALELARGDWIAHLDDDEIFEADHLQALLRFAHDHQFEFVYSRTYAETGPGNWKLMQPNLAIGVLPHSSVLFRTYLRLFKFDPNAWHLDLAGDRHVWLRMQRAGVRMGYLDKQVTTAPLRPGTTSWGRRAEDRMTAP